LDHEADLIGVGGEHDSGPSRGAVDPTDNAAEVVILDRGNAIKVPGDKAADGPFVARGAVDVAQLLKQVV